MGNCRFLFLWVFLWWGEVVGFSFFGSLYMCVYLGLCIFFQLLGGGCWGWLSGSKGFEFPKDSFWWFWGVCASKVKEKMWN